MNTSPQEEEDASRVDEASAAIQNGLNDAALLILREVVRNTPKTYIYKFQQEDALSIKFWDKAEFLQFINWHQENGGMKGIKNVYWIPSAYPRAYYYLGFISIEENRLKEAVDYLSLGQTLEPTNPRFVVETGQVAMKMKEFKVAASVFDQVPSPGPHVTGVMKAVALRGKGMALIELGDLNLAESTLKESLYYDPDNKLAHNEIGYIQHLRAGNVPSPAGPVIYKPTEPTKCKKCGKLFQLGQVTKQGGALIYLCDECFAGGTNKKWWEVWK